MKQFMKLTIPPVHAAVWMFITFASYYRLDDSIFPHIAGVVTIFWVIFSVIYVSEL